MPDSDNTAPATRKAPTEEDWSRHRAQIIRLYLQDEWKLKNVATHMSENQNHHATLNMYKKRLKSWKVRKNYTAQDKERLLKCVNADETHKTNNDVGYSFRDRPLKFHKLKRYQNELLRTQARLQICSTEAEIANQTDDYLNPRDTCRPIDQLFPTLFSNLTDPENLLRLIYDDVAHTFIADFNQKLTHLQTGCDESTRKVWHPSHSQELYSDLSVAFQRVESNNLSGAVQSFIKMCSMATKIADTVNASMPAMLCMVLGHPLWRICPDFRDETLRFFRPLMMQNKNTHRHIQRVLRYLEDFTVTRYVACLMSSPGVSSLGYIWKAGLLDQVLSKSTKFYIHTNHRSVEYALPNARPALVRAIERLMMGKSSQSFHDLKTIDHQRWWPGPANSNGHISYQYQLG